MSGSATPGSFETVAARYRDLWTALTRNSAGPREPLESRLLLDSVRDALDRRQSRLEREQAAFIANSFACEAVVSDRLPFQVLKLRHRDLGSLHALKTLHRDHASDAVARDALLREAGFGLRIRHRNVIATQVVLRLEDGRPAIVSEWAETSLSAVMARAPLSLAEIAQLTKSVLCGLAAIHEQGLVHADIAPSNILMNGRAFEEARIADLGVAVEAGRRHTEIGMVRAGQAQFRAPEQAAEEALDGRADLHAWGRVMELQMELCSGDAEALAPLAQRLVARDRDDRPESAETALRLLVETVPT